MRSFRPADTKPRQIRSLGQRDIEKSHWMRHARFFQQAGVPDQQAKDFVEMIVMEYPYPTDEDLFLEQISSPLVAMALGERLKNLSYYRTRVPEFTSQDMQLFKECLKEWDLRMKASPEDREKFLDVVFKRGFLQGRWNRISAFGRGIEGDAFSGRNNWGKQDGVPHQDRFADPGWISDQTRENKGRFFKCEGSALAPSRSRDSSLLGRNGSKRLAGDTAPPSIPVLSRPLSWDPCDPAV